MDPAGGPTDDGRTILPPTRHRAPVPFHEAIRRMLPPLAAVSAIVLVIALLLVLNRPGHKSEPSLGAGPAVTSPSPTASAISTPSTTPSPSVSPTPHRTVPVDEPSATASPRATKLPVTVLNNSRRTGLAADAAGQLSRGGWPIRDVGNFTGRIAESTAYFAPGQEGVAHALARQFPAIRRVLPRFSGLPGSGLTLVVTRDWPA